jgi:hypothetical protein
MDRTKCKTAVAQGSATIGFETKRWLSADKLRNNMHAEHTYVVASVTK